MKIFLDDERAAPDDSWVVLRNGSALAGMLLVHGNEIEEVSFDHDLADFGGIDGRELTGYTWLCQIEAMVANGELKYVPKLSVHSANPSIYKKMQQTIESIERMRNVAE